MTQSISSSHWPTARPKRYQCLNKPKNLSSLESHPHLPLQASPAKRRGKPLPQPQEPGRHRSKRNSWAASITNIWKEWMRNSGSTLLRRLVWARLRSTSGSGISRTDNSRMRKLLRDNADSSLKFTTQRQGKTSLQAFWKNSPEANQKQLSHYSKYRNELWLATWHP